MLDGLAERLPLKAIAAGMGVRISTVSVWQVRAMAKLGATDRFAAIRVWRRRRQAK